MSPDPKHIFDAVNDYEREHGTEAAVKAIWKSLVIFLALMACIIGMPILLN